MDRLFDTNYPSKELMNGYDLCSDIVKFYKIYNTFFKENYHRCSFLGGYSQEHFKFAYLISTLHIKRLTKVTCSTSDLIYVYLLNLHLVHAYNYLHAISIDLCSNESKSCFCI